MKDFINFKKGMINIGLIEFCEFINNIMMSIRYRRVLNNNGCYLKFRIILLFRNGIL